jgi:hypothetical protein
VGRQVRGKQWARSQDATVLPWRAHRPNSASVSRIHMGSWYTRTNFASRGIESRFSLLHDPVFMVISYHTVTFLQTFWRLGNPIEIVFQIHAIATHARTRNNMLQTLATLTWNHSDLGFLHFQEILVALGWKSIMWHCFKISPPARNRNIVARHKNKPLFPIKLARALRARAGF